MSNTQEGLITVESATDLSASIGCFAIINSSAQAALPSANALVNYVIEDAYTSGGAYKVVLRPLNPNRNFRVPCLGVVTAADKIVATAAGKAATATSGGHWFALAEESGVNGQYVLIRPIGGDQTAS